MDNVRPWAMWRRIYYGSGFASFWILVGLLVYFTNFYEPANCFDGELNGDEVEVDAGGSCVRLASSAVMQPNIVWAESFEITPGQYNSAAYIENRNAVAATPELRYTFILYNNGTVVTERSGTTVLPPNSSYPIFEGRIFTDGQEITDTELVIEPPEVWIPAMVGSEQFRTIDIDLQNVDTRPSLDVQLENTALTAAENVEVVATIFNDAGRAVTASETFVESFAPRSTADIQFTWPNSIAKTVRSCSIPTSVVLGIDLSGSMNNDQDNPPQPVTDALAAASTFVGNLNAEDKAGVVTFATEASTVQTLTSDQAAVQTIIDSLTISAEAETGYTNTPAALQAASAELSSQRHSQNARRALVLLTDGLPTAEGDTDVIAQAQAAARDLALSGADVYVIGLGEQVDQTFVRSIASDPTNAYLAPSRSDLERIYAEITASLCEVGPTKIEVIAKTETNFAPLR
jgi:Mg-chelatase subunit ChlD